MASPRRKSGASARSSKRVSKKSSQRGTSTSASDVRATGLRFVTMNQQVFVVVALEDGRVIITPIAWYPLLQRATPSQREQWSLIGRGRGFTWPDLDIDLSVHGMLAGIPDLTRRARQLSTPRSAYARVLKQLHAGGLLRAG